MSKNEYINKNGEDMIIDIELTAKPITDGEFWILTQGDKKVGNVCANSAGYGVQLAGSFFQFESTKDIQKKTKIKFISPPAPKEKLEVPYPEYPTTSRIYNSVYDVKRGLHVFTKTAKSKCFHSAGYFVVSHNGIEEVIFCPKYIFIQRYPFKGPFKSKEEARIEINI
jgi:hypothetical protein